jgi:uncharacterized membrane protein
MFMLGTGEREAARDRDRIVNLSDGVFAIALTLLVLDIRVPNIPESVVGSELPSVLLALWPKYLGYFLNFVVISTFWIWCFDAFLEKSESRYMASTTICRSTNAAIGQLRTMPEIH